MEMDKAEREYLKSQERQRKSKQESADRYQELLDKQLAERRDKSLITLKGIFIFSLFIFLTLLLTRYSLTLFPSLETMAPREKQMNAALFKKFGIQQN